MSFLAIAFPFAMAFGQSDQLPQPHLEVVSHGEGPVFSAQFSTDEDLIVTASKGALARVWDLRLGRPALEIKSASTGGVFARFGTNDREVLTVSSNGSLGVWSYPDGKVKFQIPGSSKLVRYASVSEGGTVAVIQSEQGLVIKGMRTGRTLLQFSPSLAMDSQPVWLAGGKLIALAVRGEGVRIYDLTKPKPAVSGCLHLKPNQRVLTLIAVNDTRLGKGPMIAAGTDDGQICLWGPEGSNTGRVFETGFPVERLAVNPDTAILIAVNRAKKMVHANNYVNGVSQTFPLPNLSDLGTVTPSPSGAYVAAASPDGQCRVYSADGRELCALIGLDEGWVIVDAHYNYDDNLGGQSRGVAWVAGKQVVALRSLRKRYFKPEPLSNGRLASLVHNALYDLLVSVRFGGIEVVRSLDLTITDP